MSNKKSGGKFYLKAGAKIGTAIFKATDGKTVILRMSQEDFFKKVVQFKQTDKNDKKK